MSKTTPSCIPMNAHHIRAEAGLIPTENRKFVIYSGNSNPALASEVAVHLGTQVGRSITSSADDEHFVSHTPRICVGWRANP